MTTEVTITTVPQIGGDDVTQFVEPAGIGEFHCTPAWHRAVCQGLHYPVYLLRAEREGQLVGVLPLALVKSWLFGRFLVSLPYVNTGGVVASDEAAAAALMDRAVELADRLRVRHLELRHERHWPHPKLDQTLTSKVHMRLSLPETSEALWTAFKASVRNQIRKGESHEFDVQWGGLELLDAFYGVFSRRMRDLGTPVYGRSLFRAILESMPQRAEFCAVRKGPVTVAAALLVHGPVATEVPSASSLASWNPTNANMFMYWQLLQRAIERGQSVFDFGRSSEDAGTHRFKKQWGAQPHPAIWQYYLREGQLGEMRPDNAKYRLLIATWKRLPLWLANLIGPCIVRGIP